MTGAGSGIGAATAYHLAADGAIVVLGDLDEAAAQAEACAIVSGGGAASTSFVNLGQEDSIVAFYAQLREEHDRLDILHNNAADTRPAQLARDQTIAAMEPGVWDQAFRVNARGTMLMIKHGRRLHHQHQLRRGARGRHLELGLWRVEGPDHQPDARRGGAARAASHPLQRPA